jgi:hypothetical protein
MDYLTIYYKNLSEQLQSQASLLEQKINIMKKLCEAPSEWDMANIVPDDLVGGADLGILLGDWSTDTGEGDVDGDGDVDGQDLGRLLGSWGSNPANNTNSNTTPNVEPTEWDKDYYSTTYPFRRSVKGKTSPKKK